MTGSYWFSLRISYANRDLVETPSPDSQLTWRCFGLAQVDLFCVPRDFSFPVVLLPVRGNTRHGCTGTQLAVGPARLLSEKLNMRCTCCLLILTLWSAAAGCNNRMPMCIGSFSLHSKWIGLSKRDPNSSVLRLLSGGFYAWSVRCQRHPFAAGRGSWSPGPTGPAPRWALSSTSESPPPPRVSSIPFLVALPGQVCQGGS